MVLLLIMPWLLLLARTRLYPGVRDPCVRVGGALFAGVAALAWITQRVSGQGNAVTAAVEGAALGTMARMARPSRACSSSARASSAAWTTSSESCTAEPSAPLCRA